MVFNQSAFCSIPALNIGKLKVFLPVDLCLFPSIQERNIEMTQSTLSNDSQIRNPPEMKIQEMKIFHGNTTI